MKIYYSFTFHPKFINDSLHICARSTCTCIKDREFDNNQSVHVFTYNFMSNMHLKQNIKQKIKKLSSLQISVQVMHMSVILFLHKCFNFCSILFLLKSVILFLLNYQLNTSVSLHCTVNHLFMPIPVSICMRCTNFKNISQKNTDNLWCKIFSLTSLFKKAKSTKNSSKVLGFLS